MVATQLGVDAPNGNVGVSGPMSNGEWSQFTAGVKMGFSPKFTGMNVAPAGNSQVNYCQAVDAAGNIIFIGGVAADQTSVALTAPTTAGQSICYAIVMSVDATATTTANNGTGLPQLTAVAGTPATSGTETPPNDATIRAAITNGATAYVCVVQTITVDYGQNSLSAKDVNRSNLIDTPINGETLYQSDPCASNLRGRYSHPMVTTNDGHADQSASWWCTNGVVTFVAVWHHTNPSWQTGHILTIPKPFAPRKMITQLCSKDNSGEGEADTAFVIDVDGTVTWSNRGGKQGFGLCLGSITYVL